MKRSRNAATCPHHLLGVRMSENSKYELLTVAKVLEIINGVLRISLIPGTAHEFITGVHNSGEHRP